MPETIGRLRVHSPNRYGLSLVLDIPTSEYHELYVPFTPAQIAAGHVEGRWYHRPTTWVKDTPASVPYREYADAIQALTAIQFLKELINAGQAK